MLKYRQSRLIKTGILGAILIILATAIGLQPQALVALATSLRYQALFTEAGGLEAGNDVKIAGTIVGKVDSIDLNDDGNAVVIFAIKSAIRLGTQTTVHIRTGSLLGARIVTVEPLGPGRLHASDIIPTSRTSSPYSLNEAVDDLTNNVTDTDIDSINHALDTLSATIDQIAPQLGPTFDGLTRVSRSLNHRAAHLGELLKSAAAVTKIVSDRSSQVNRLLLDGNDLFAMLVERRNQISDLLATTSILAKQLSGVITDNEHKLGPTLDQLNAVTAMLQKNRDNISKALPGLQKFELTSGETVSNGFYYSAYVPNLSMPELLQPFFDYAFGFRTGDPTQPRAQFPWPRNAIPGGTR